MHRDTTTIRLDGQTLRRLAFKAQVHERTIANYMALRPMRPSIAKRIEGALKAACLHEYVRLDLSRPSMRTAEK